MSWWQIALITFVPVVSLLLLGVPAVYVISRLQKRRLLNKHESVAVVQKPAEHSTTPGPPEKTGHIDPELLAEIEENYKIAKDSHTDELMFFKTNVWDNTKQHVPDSLADLREELVQAYIDIGLANNIVWMSTELKFRSQNLDDQYVGLCAKIVARLDRMKHLLASTSSNT